MAFRLSDFFLGIYLDNTRRNSTHGQLLLKGMEAPVVIQLTGDAGETLKGRAISVQARDEGTAERAPKGLAMNQIGATGTMGLRMAKIPRGKIEEIDWTKGFEFDWKPLLYLEWFSQNGRVVLELPDPDIALVEGQPVPDLDLPRVELVEEDEAGEPGEFPPDPSGAFGGNAESDLDGYLEALNRQTEASYRGEADGDDEGGHEAGLTDELEICELLLNHEESEYVGSFLKPRSLPPLEEVDEESAGELVKNILSELALRAIAVHLCEHCTMRQAYGYILTEILHEERVHPDIGGGGWTVNFNYGETCPKCGEEIDERWGDGDPFQPPE